MSAPPTTRGEPITDRRQLVAYLESGCKPAQDWRIGTEHEKFAYRVSDNRPLPYDGPDGIGELLKRLCLFEGRQIFSLEVLDQRELLQERVDEDARPTRLRR